MAQYINKAAVVAEIERRLEALANTSAGYNREFAAIIGAQQYELISLVQYINTLEVKEVEKPNASDRGMAEEIIINLKRVEQDYRIDLTKEIEWLRNNIERRIVMVQHIDISVLLAEIEREYKSLSNATDDFAMGRKAELKNILSFLDTTDTKEVEEEPVSNDLEAEFVLYLKHKFNIPQEGNTLKTDGWRPSPYDLLDIAKHFAQWQKKQEVKEVDLEKEIHSAADQYDINNNGNIYWEDIVGFAKHFFELGLKAQKGE